eukprot:TRINITY_DN2595_c0_g1_i3.p1 TRINITY_DN2595_c0_g1~~TRINITY_DN2595_c0_g1_i3.p1  ORF type:complete len:133 (+),score=36.32 TRINITY_DN2595_c0_g1_i3:51-449(+)
MSVRSEESMSVTSEESGEERLLPEDAPPGYSGKFYDEEKQEENCLILEKKVEEESWLRLVLSWIPRWPSVLSLVRWLFIRKDPEVHMPFSPGVDKKLIEGRCEEEGEAGHSAEPDHYGKQQRKWVTQNGVEH